MWAISRIVLINNYWCLWEFGKFSQQWGMLHYATFWSGDYWPQVEKLCVHAINNINYFERDYKHIILWVREVLPFKVLLLEGWDGQTWKDHMCICAPCHFCMLMAKLTHIWRLFLLYYVVYCVGSLLELPLCWFVIGVPKVGIWNAIHHH
jgi:hypothetical protein